MAKPYKIPARPETQRQGNPLTQGGLMARKIADISQSKVIYLKRSVAFMLIRRQIADWEVRNVSLRRRDARDIPANYSTLAIEPIPTYIPAEIPPDNIDKSLGVRWQPPKNAPTRSIPAVMSKEEFLAQ